MLQLEYWQNSTPFCCQASFCRLNVDNFKIYQTAQHSVNNYNVLALFCLAYWSSIFLLAGLGFQNLGSVIYECPREEKFQCSVNLIRIQNLCCLKTELGGILIEIYRFAENLWGDGAGLGGWQKAAMKDTQMLSWLIYLKWLKLKNTVYRY